MDDSRWGPSGIDVLYANDMRLQINMELNTRAIYCDIVKVIEVIREDFTILYSRKNNLMKQ